VAIYDYYEGINSNTPASDKITKKKSIQQEKVGKVWKIFY